MPRLFYLPLANRQDFVALCQADIYFQSFLEQIGEEELYPLGSLYGHGYESGTLYILGHGSFNATIGLREPFNDRALTPEQLGAHLLGDIDVAFPDFLEMQGQRILSPRINKIKVFACMSGVAPDNNSHSFAQRLGAYLRQRHVFTPVYGYTGLTQFAGGGKRVVRGFNELVKAKKRRVKFTAGRPGEKRLLSQEAQDSLADGHWDFVFDEDAVEDWHQF